MNVLEVSTNVKEGKQELLLDLDLHISSSNIMSSHF